MPDNIPGADPQPSVAPRQIPSEFNDNRVSPEQFGAGTGDELQRQGAVAGDVSSEYLARANAVKIEDAFGRAQKVLNDVILDPQNGYLGLKGADALAKSQQYREKFTQGLQQIRGGLDETQKRELGFRLDRLQESGIRLAASHERGQHDVIAEATSRGAENASTEALISIASQPQLDPETLAKTLRGGVSDLVENATQDARYRYGQGASADAIKAIAIPRVQAAAALAVESAMATENPDHARRVFDTLRPFLGTRAGLLAGGQIQRRADQRDGISAAQQIAASHRIPGTSLIDEGADEEIGTRGLSPEAMKEASSELQRLKVASRQVQTQRNNTAFAAGLAAVHQYEIAATQEAKAAALKTFNKQIDVLSVPEADGGSQLERLLQFQQSQAKRDMNSPAVQREQANALVAATDFLHASRASDFQSAEAFLAQKVQNDPQGRTIGETLSNAGIGTVRGEFQKKAEKEAADKPLSGHAYDMLHKSLVDALDFPPAASAALNEDQTAQRNHVADYVRSQRNAWQEANHTTNEPPDEKYQEWVNDQTLKIPDTAPGWFSANKRRVNIEIEQEAMFGQHERDATLAAPPEATPAPAPQAPAAPAKKPPPPPPAGSVWMYKNGVRGAVPESKKEAALKAGYTLE